MFRTHHKVELAGEEALRHLGGIGKAAQQVAEAHGEKPADGGAGRHSQPLRNHEVNPWKGRCESQRYEDACGVVVVLVAVVLVAVELVVVVVAVVLKMVVALLVVVVVEVAVVLKVVVVVKVVVVAVFLLYNKE